MPRRAAKILGMLLAAAVPLAGRPAGAQVLPSGPEESPAPGAGASALGNSPGAGSSPLGSAPGAGEGFFIGRPGSVGPHYPSTLTRPGPPFVPPAPSGIVPPPALPITEAPAYGPLSEPAGSDEGPPNGLTLDGAIERMIGANPELRTQFYEIPQAEADILTASLRANPLFYADTILVPYGSYSQKRPGGQTQYDVSIAYPLDVTRKRRARTLVACRAKRVLEAQFQDAVRLQIDNVYTAFVDVLAARETLRYARASLGGLDRLLEQIQDLKRAGQKTEADVSAIEVQHEVAEIGLREAGGALRKARMNLALLLNLPVARAEALQVRGTIRLVGYPPPPDDRLVSIALEHRPDLAAYRLGIARAEADVRLARANRYSDVYLTYTPYTFQNNAPFNTQSATSWGVAVTAPMPIYNRNQGNILRAKLNVDQTRSGLDALERRVAAEVLQADQEYDLSLAAILELESDLLPEARRVRNDAFRLFLGGEGTVISYLEAQRSYNDTVRQYRDALVRHRRSMLDLNTALGRRVLP